MFTSCIFRVFKFLADAGLLDMKEQNKPFVCLKKPNLSRRPNEDMEGQSQMDGWLGCSLEKSLLRESLIPITTVQYVLLTYWTAFT